MIHASASDPFGVSPQQAEAIANTITPMTTMVRRPSASASLPPKANSADSDSR